MRNLTTFTGIAILLLAAACHARPYRPPQRPEPGPGDGPSPPAAQPVAGFTPGHVEYPFQLFTPKLESGRRYPLVIVLHGAGKQGNDNRKQLGGSGPRSFADAKVQIVNPCFLLAPQMQGGWRADKLKRLIDHLQSKHPIDGARIYCTGQSMGGFGTANLAAAYPNLLAAIAPIAGSGDPKQAPKIKDLPYWGFHGAKDGAVPVASHRAFIEALKTAGGKPKYTELPEGKHNVWDHAWNFTGPQASGLDAWLFAQRRGAAPQPPQPPDPQPPQLGAHGYFLLQGVDRRTVTDAEMQATNIVGLSIRFSWAAVQPQSGQFDWSFVDAEVARAKRLGKQVLLRPMAGINAPAWLYEQGAQSTISDPRGDGSPGSKMPVPWDPVMLTAWERFVAEFGRRYSAETAVAAVHLSGPTGNSAEMHLPHGLPREFPNAIERTDAAWQRAIDAYAAAFLTTAVSLNLANPYTAQDGLLRSVSDYARRKLGNRCTLQNNSLSARTSRTFKPVEMIAAFNGLKGFQMLTGSSNPRFGGGFAEAIRIGESCGAQFYEIYREDVRQVSNLPRRPEP